MPLDVPDYEKISTMIKGVEQKLDTSIGRVEIKIDELRKEVVPTDVQSLVNGNVKSEIEALRQRMEKLENAPGLWLVRLGVIFSVALSLFEILTHVKLLP